MADIDAVLFDTDGTLVDSDAAVERSWRAWARRYDVEPEAVFAVMYGAPAPRTVEGYLLPARRLGVAPEACLVVEDIA